MSNTTVLSDRELEIAYFGGDEARKLVPAMYPILRAVEAAVLKRVAEIDIDSPVILHRGHEYVSVEEARERERQAWDAALVYTLGAEPALSKFLVAERDRRYPSLLPKTPPPLTLSTGTWTRLDGGSWRTEGVDFPDKRETRWLLGTQPQIATAADADALAAWLRTYGDR